MVRVRYFVYSILLAMAFEPSSSAGIYYEKNVGTTFDGIGIATGHLTEIRLRVTKDELKNGPPGAGGGAHGLLSVSFIIDPIYKEVPFVFDGFQNSALWPSDAWIATYHDPLGVEILTISANTAVYGDQYLLQTADDFLDFSFQFEAPATFSGYSVQAFFIGTDPTSPSFGQVTEEDSTHPFVSVPEPSSVALLSGGMVLILGIRQRLQRRKAG